MTNVAGDLARTSTVTSSAAVKKSRRDWVFISSVAWLVVVSVVVVLGELLPFVVDPDEINPDKIAASPSRSNWFGNASFGEDVFSQVVIGGRLSLAIALSVTAIGIVVGGAMGLLAGYLRGGTDSVTRVIINATLSIPALVLVIFIVAVFQQSVWVVIFAVSLLAIPALARIVRASTLQVADRDYVKAAEVLGVKKFSILFREVLPNVMPTFVSFAFLTTGIVLVVESSLSFLGLSVQSPKITWGSIISEGRIRFDETPHMVFLPGLVLFLTVLALNFVGDRLLKRFDIREAGL